MQELVTQVLQPRVRLVEGLMIPWLMESPVAMALHNNQTAPVPKGPKETFSMIFEAFDKMDCNLVDWVSSPLMDLPDFRMALWWALCLHSVEQLKKLLKDVYKGQYKRFMDEHVLLAKGLF